MSLEVQPRSLEAVWLGRVAYGDTLAQMGEWQSACKAQRMPDTVFYLEHEPVITSGRGASEGDLRRKPHNIPVVEVARGGKATYHGPGQLIGYGIIDLAARAPGLRPDIEEYIRAIEDGLVSYLRAEHQLPAQLCRGFTGVWIDDVIPRKIASIGISARRWVSGHGFALNISTELRAFESIIPCGMPGVEMTSVVEELRRRGDTDLPLELKAVAGSLHNHLTDALRARGYGSFV